MTVESPENVSNSSPESVKENKTVNNSEVKKPSPAQDLRDIQGLLVNGIFPGQIAPAVVKAYNLLEQMAVQIEAAQAAPKEVVNE